MSQHSIISEFLAKSINIHFQTSFIIQKYVPSLKTTETRSLYKRIRSTNDDDDDEEDTESKKKLKYSFSRYYSFINTPIKQGSQLVFTNLTETADSSTDAILDFSDRIIKHEFFQHLLDSTTIQLLRLDVGFDSEANRVFLNEIGTFPDASLGLNVSYHNIGQRLAQLLASEAVAHVKKFMS